MMIDFKEIAFDSDHWEMFARDFLQTLGFFIESSPDRGPDGGKDMLVTEEVRGNIYNGRVRWLVSCKHFATSENSVNENDEKNILERMTSFKADGFLGFYSTIPSSGLNTRLRQLKDNSQIKEYRIFDGKLIENYLIASGFSQLMFRYFPESYKIIKPLHLITSKYEPLLCDYCGKDLVMSLFQEEYSGLIAFVQKTDSENGVDYVEDVYCACKGDCDRILQANARLNGCIDGWRDISDTVIPVEFLRFVLALMNRLRSGEDVYSDKAYKKIKNIIIALAQKVFRFTTEDEQKRFISIMQMPF